MRTVFAILILLFSLPAHGADFIVVAGSRHDAVNGSAIVKTDGEHIEGSPKGIPNGQPLVDTTQGYGPHEVKTDYRLDSLTPIGNSSRVIIKSSSNFTSGAVGTDFINSNFNYRGDVSVSNPNWNAYVHAHSSSKSITQATIYFDNNKHVNTVSKWGIRFQMLPSQGVEKQFNVSMKGKIGTVANLTCYYDKSVKHWRVTGTRTNSHGSALPKINDILYPNRPENVLPNGMLGRVYNVYLHSNVKAFDHLQVDVNGAGGIGWIAKGQIIHSESPPGPFNQDIRNSGGVSIIYKGVTQRF